MTDSVAGRIGRKSFSHEFLNPVKQLWFSSTHDFKFERQLREFQPSERTTEKAKNGDFDRFVLMGSYNTTKAIGNVLRKAVEELVLSHI